MSALQDIKAAISDLNPEEKALLAAELFAMNAEPDEAELKAALDRGLADVKAGHVRPIEEVRSMIPQWSSKSRYGGRSASFVIPSEAQRSRGTPSNNG